MESRMSFTQWRFAVAVTSLALIAGCGDSTGNPPPVEDAGPDSVVKDTGTTPDVVMQDRVVTDTPKPPRDNGPTPDVTTDVGLDAGPPPTDTGPAPDATTDTGPSPDVPMDAGPPPDVATDAGAPPDVRPDSGPVDAGPPNACAMPRGTITLPSASPVMVMGSTVGAGSTFPSTRCQTNNSGPDVVYTLVVTARTGVILSTDNAGTTNDFDTTLSIRRTCSDAMTEVSCDDDSGSGTNRTATSVLRAVLDPGMYTVIVDGYAGDEGTYALTATTFTPGANATCATARTITPGMPLTGQTLDNAGNPGTCAPGLTPGGQVFYSVTIPASSVGTVQLSRAMGTWTYALRVYADCNAAACLQNGTSATSPYTQVIANASAMPRTYVLSVASNDSGATVTPFDIGVTTAALMPGQACETAVTLTPGAPLTGQSNMGAPISAAPCRSENGGQRFYSVTIPAGQRARVTATPTGATMRQPVLRAFDNCTATTCVDNALGGTSTTPAAASVDIPNAGTTPRTVIVSLASVSPATAGTWDVAAALSPLVAGQFCASPAVLTPGMTLSAQDARNGLRASPACAASTANGGQLFYQVTVPANQRVTVRAVPMGAMAAWTPTVRVLGTCTATSCIDSSTAAMAGGPATVNLVNNMAMPRDFLVSVAGTSTTAGTFNLEASAGMNLPGYTVDNTVAASCDDLAMGTAVMPAGGWSDDSTTAIAMLPFTFQFFAAPQTHWSMNSNGLLQLYPNAMGSTSTAYINTAIASQSTPNGFIAAFWDDLRIVTAPDGGTGTSARYATLGTGSSRRFVAQWTDFTFASPSTVRLTFQVKLFETTNVIEMHYCSITPATDARAGGNEATFGAEDPTGTIGAHIATNMTDVVRTGRAFRLTPR